MLEFNPSSSDSGGDASAAMPAADTGAIESGGIQTDAAPETNFDSGSENTDPNPVIPETEANDPAPESLVTADDDPEAALAAYAADANTPQFAREQIKKAMAYASSLKSTIGEREQALQQFQSQYEGKEVLEPTEIERLRQADEVIYELASPVATPDTISEKLQSMMGNENYASLQNHLIWSALSKPDGTPDVGSIQMVVDSLTGEAGAVDATDVLEAISALKEGRIEKSDLHVFETQEAYESFQRQKAMEKDLQDRQHRAEENLVFQEQQIRQTEVSRYQASLQSEFNQKIEGLLGQYKLKADPNDPPEAAEYKERMNIRIANLVNGAATRHREFGDLEKALTAIQAPRKMDAKTASEQIGKFLGTPQVAKLRDAGLSKLMSDIEKVVVRDARGYALMMKGLEIENSKGQQARPVLGAPNQAAAMEGLTEGELAKMSGRERADYAARRLTAELRAGGPQIGARGIG